MNTAKQQLDRAQAAGKVKERDNYLSLAPKNSEGVPTPNGQHRIVLVKDEKTTNSMGKEQLTVTVKEGGVEKIWNIKLKDDEGNLHYLVQILADYNEGDELIVEMKKNGAKNFVDVKRVEASMHPESIKTIQLDEDGEEILPPLHGGKKESEDINPADIPF